MQFRGLAMQAPRRNTPPPSTRCWRFSTTRTLAPKSKGSPDTPQRMHNGYAPQIGGTSGGYYSALVSTAPQALAGQSKTPLPPIVFIINDRTPPLTEIFSGLQGTGRALIVQEGEATEEPGVNSHRIKLTDGVIVRMRTNENVNPDGSVGFAADVVVPKTDKEDAALNEALKNISQNTVGRRNNKAAAPPAALRDLKDDAYPAMEFPAAEYRLLALFRFWNIINFFFPYKHLIGGSWADILPRYIPKFEADKDALEYQMTLREMVAEIHDSHGFVSGTTKYDQFIGGFAPPFQVRYVEKQTVVTTVMDAKAGVTAGDVVLAIDGVPVEKRRVELARFICASTPQALERRVHYQLLAGAKDSVVKLEVRRADGATHQIAAARTLSLNDPKYYMGSARTTPVMQVLPAGFGYVDLARLQVAQVDKMFETLKDAPAIIFDMRGYPNGTAWAIAPRLTEKTHVTAAQFWRPILEATSLANSDYSSGTNFTFGQQIPERKGDVYKGKVVMLIDEDAISQAEHTCMFFEAATDVTFIGTPTAGANGDVTNMVLPGNIRVNFSGHDVRHADGRQLQRVGIQPTIRVEPTVADIRSGRDAVLEAAIDYLQQKANK
jgi:C-terminal processing protease CtpA/Prc